MRPARPPYLVIGAGTVGITIASELKRRSSRFSAYAGRSVGQLLRRCAHHQRRNPCEGTLRKVAPDWRELRSDARIACEQAVNAAGLHADNVAHRFDVSRNHLLTWRKVGIRTQMLDRTTNMLVTDFLVEAGPCSTHVLNAISPAFTSAFPFAKHARDTNILR